MKPPFNRSHATFWLLHHIAQRLKQILESYHCVISWYFHFYSHAKYLLFCLSLPFFTKKSNCFAFSFFFDWAEGKAENSLDDSILHVDVCAEGLVIVDDLPSFDQETVTLRSNKDDLKTLVGGQVSDVCMILCRYVCVWWETLIQAENKSSKTFAEYKQQPPRGFNRKQCDKKHMAECVFQVTHTHAQREHP